MSKQYSLMGVSNVVELSKGGFKIKDNSEAVAFFYTDEVSRAPIASGDADLDGAVTINDSGADKDFRVEGSGKANALFVQGSDGYVGVNTSTPSYPFTALCNATNNAGLNPQLYSKTSLNSAAANINSWARSATGATGQVAPSSGSANVSYSAGVMGISSGGALGSTMGSTTALLGQVGSYYDGTVTTAYGLYIDMLSGSPNPVNTYGMYIDAGTGTNKYGIYQAGTADDNYLLGPTYIDNAVVINDSGADKDFRVEGSGQANALFVQGSDGYVGVGTSTPDSVLEVNGSVKLTNAADNSDSAIWDPTAEGNAGSLTAGYFYSNYGYRSKSNQNLILQQHGSSGNVDINVGGANTKIRVNSSGVNVKANAILDTILIESHDDITATSEGVAASVATGITFVATNGDSDLDNVTLADGVEGQIKRIVCVSEGNAADTWKITPANMVGGTQITFSGVGEGCTLVFYSTTGWVISANNGGTIS